MSPWVSLKQLDKLDPDLTAPSQAEFQLGLDTDDQNSGNTVGSTFWIAEGLKIQEDQSVLKLILHNISLTKVSKQTRTPPPYCPARELTIQQNTIGHQPPPDEASEESGRIQ